MHPYLTQVLAEQRIADLHREAEAQRRNRPVASRRSRPARTGTLTGRLAALVRPVTPAPACCPA